MATPIHVLAYDEGGLDEVHAVSMQEARALVGRRRVAWINVDREDDPDVLASLEQDLGIHPLTVEDVKNTHQRPKIEEYPGYLYIVAQMLRRDSDGEMSTEQVSILLGDDWVLTVQERSGDVFDGVRTRIRNGRPRIRMAGPDYLLYALLDAIVDAYFPILEQIGIRAEELEDRILEDPQFQERGELQAIRRELLTLRRVAWPQRDALNALERGDDRWIKSETRTFLRDVTDHAARVLDFVETNRELAASLMDLYLASVAHRTNEVMKVLTVVATIFIPLTFIVGIYGMNFEHMPELDVWWAYPAIMVFMASLGIGMFLTFRRRGWV